MFERLYLRLCDFGATYPIEQKTSWSGTPSFTSPQALQEEYKGSHPVFHQEENPYQTDIFCLGMTLIYMFGFQLLHFDSNRVNASYERYILQFETDLKTFFHDKPLLQDLFWHMCHPCQTQRYHEIQQVLDHPVFQQLQPCIPFSITPTTITPFPLFNRAASIIMPIMKGLELPDTFQLKVVSLLQRYLQTISKNESEYIFLYPICIACFDIMLYFIQATDFSSSSTSPTSIRLRHRIIEAVNGHINTVF